MIKIAVRGLPIAQGSARAFMARGRAFVATEGNRPNSPLGAWRSSIASEARQAMGDTPAIAGPVGVTIVFTLPRPQSHWRKTPAGPVIRDSAPTWHANKPDIDKLTRSVLDALTVVAIRDDSQVVSLLVQKWYERDTRPVGVTIEIDEFAP